MDKFYIPLSRYKNMVKRSTITNTLAGILISTASNLYSQNRSIEFEKDTIWENTLEKAKKEDKLIFLDVYTDWCVWCKSMEKKVFTRDDVADFYNANFINARINAEKGSGKKLKKIYNFKGYPTLLFLDGDGGKSYQNIGALDPSELIELGEKALKTEKFNKEPESKKDGKAVYENIQRLGEVNLDYRELLEDYFKTQKEEDMTSRINWEIIKFDENLGKIYSKHFKFLLENKEKFDSLYTIDSVNREIFQSYSRNLLTMLKIRPEDSASIYKVWADKAKESKFHRLDEVLLEGKVNYDWQIMKWNSLTFKNAITLLDSTKRGEEIKKGYDLKESFNDALGLENLSNDALRLENIALRFYLNTDDKKLLEKALDWAKCSMELEDTWSRSDTYARLLYELGRKEEAIFYEERVHKEFWKIAKDIWTNETLKKRLEKMKKGEKIK